MNHFEYRNDELHAEDVSVAELAAKHGTPLYVYSHATIERHFRVIDDAFKKVPHTICFSVKANSNVAILRLLAKLGSGMDIVSGGELIRAKKAGVDPKKIVFSGVGKTPAEIRAALETGILFFNVEVEDELDEINDIAKAMGARAGITLRVNPDVDAKTHDYISTGKKANKFGIAISRAREVYAKAKALSNLDILGVDCHIGSQLTSTGPFVEALTRLKDLVLSLRKDGIEVKYADIGGGLGVTYKDEEPPSPEQYAADILEVVGDMGVHLVLEPGRVIVANAGVLVTKVLYRKENEGKRFVIVDGAMNDLVRPTLYGAWMAIEPVRKTKGTVIADVVGPICETGDFLAKDREVADVHSGDLLCVKSAGAYGFSMSSNYNTRPRAAEILVHGKVADVIRERETVEELLSKERLPEFLK
jgi:diaminopimelate decarboxylase